MLEIGEEIAVFLQAFLAGSMVFLVYCCIRIVRRLIKHNLFFVSVEDFLFWTGTGIYLFVEIYNTSDGSIRWFFVTGVMIGGMLTYGVTKLAGKLYQKIHEKMIDS